MEEVVCIQCMWVLYWRVLCNHPYLFLAFCCLLCMSHFWCFIFLFVSCVFIFLVDSRK